MVYMIAVAQLRFWKPPKKKTNTAIDKIAEVLSEDQGPITAILQSNPVPNVLVDRCKSLGIGLTYCKKIM